MTRKTMTYGDILARIKAGQPPIRLLVHVLPGRDFDEVVHIIRDDDMSPKGLADLIMSHAIQIIHPDDAEDVVMGSSSPLLQPPLAQRVVESPIEETNSCLVDGYGDVIFFQVIDDVEKN